MMTKVEVNFDFEGARPELIDMYVEIFKALIRSGGLSGVRGGKTILHFDDMGEFQGIELDYRPWWKRRVANNN